MDFIFIILFTAGSWVETTQEDFSDGVYERNIFSSHRKGGAVEFVFKYDLDQNGYLDLFTAGHLGDSVYLYWGDTDGYRPDRRRSYDVSGGGNCDAADLNGDGYPDFVITPNRCYYFRIYWGTPSGPDPYNYQQFPLPDYAVEANFIADLNKDGYLDIIIDAYNRQITVIYWGRSTGHSPGDTTCLPTNWAVHNIEVADFNKDNWLDICLAMVNGGYNYIYWGSENGYLPGNNTQLFYYADDPSGLSTADLDDNGYLDFVFTGGSSNSYIYFGSDSGFKTSDTLMPDYTFGGSLVADLNDDGYLDIVYHRGDGWHNISNFPTIYWGSDSGYSDVNQTVFGLSFINSGGTCADFNRDGSLDIFCNVLDNSSYVFWGPDYTNYTSLPIERDHHGMFREFGNVYDREYCENYQSSTFDGGSGVGWKTLTWLDSLPPQTAIKLSVRTGNTPVPDTSWSDWVEIPNGGNIPDYLRSRYIQYLAHMTYANPAYLPILWEVKIDYGSGIEVEIFPTQNDTVLPGELIDYSFDVANLGDSIDIIDLLVSDTMSWFFTLLDTLGSPLPDNNSNGFPDIVIDSLDTIGFLLQVQVPDTILYKTQNFFELIARSSRDTIVKDTTYLNLYVGLINLLSVYPDQSDSAKAGEVVEYLLYLVNDGNADDTIDLKNFKTRPGWILLFLDSIYQPLVDHNGNGMVDVPRIPAYGGLDSFRVWIRVPDTEQIFIADTTIIKAYSGYDTLVSDTAALITYLYGKKTLIIDSSQTGSVDPGQEVVYDLTAQNLGDYPDTVELYSIGTAPGWTVVFYDTAGNPIQNLGLVNPNQTVSFSTGITAPSNSQADFIDTTVVFGRFVSDTTVYDSAILWTTVNLLPNLMLYPDQSDTGGPGDTIDFFVNVQNLANGQDYIDFRYINQYGVVLLDTLGLPLSDHNGNGLPDILLDAGEIQWIISRVYIPSNAQVGEADTITVIGSSGYNPQVTEQATLIVVVSGFMIDFVVEPDTSSRVEASHVITYNLRLDYTGNIDDVIDLEVKGIDEGWEIELVDDNGQILTDHDGDGLVDLGSIVNGIHPFGLKVRAPQWQGLVGEIFRTYIDTVAVHGYASRVTETDSCCIVTIMVPPIDIHNYPNPFFFNTSFIFSLSDDGDVTLKIYNRAGELIKELMSNRHFDLGIYRVSWDGSNRHGKRCAPGIYLYLFEFRHKGEVDKIMKKALIKGK